MWIAGNGEQDGQILKFTREGQFVLQIGKPGPQTNSSDVSRLGRPANMQVDPGTNEIYVADGYFNHRVMVFDADGAPLLVLTSGAHRVDTGKVAAEIGVTALKRATPEFVRTHTGQPIGGVAPLGHPAPLRTIVDTALAGHAEVWAAGGIPHAIYPTTYAELLRLTGGTPMDVA